MRKIPLVAQREYLATVRRKGFIVSTLGMPVFFALIWAFAGGAAYFTMRSAQSKEEVLGVVDESGLVRFDLLETIGNDPPQRPDADTLPVKMDPEAAKQLEQMGGKVRLVRFLARDEARAAFVRKEVRGYYVVPARFLDEGAIVLEMRAGGFTSSRTPGWENVRRVLTASLVTGRLEEQLARRVATPPRLDVRPLTDAGEPDPRGRFARLQSFVVPYAFAMLFMISIMSSGGYLLQSVSEEKENRVIEILLASVTTDELLAGKVLGLCAAGLTQISVWVLMVAVPAAYLLPVLDIGLRQVGVALLFFILGFLLYGSLMAGSGALGNNFRESQQASIVWTIAAVAPMFFLPALLAQPNGTVARVLSFIPLTAPITIVLRVAAAPVPWWEIALSAAMVALSLVLFVRLAAKLFRLGSLLYGKKPTLFEIVRWLKAA